MKMTVNEHELNFNILDEGRCVPLSYEILEMVGLSAISEKMEKFYDLLEFDEPSDIFKWVAYTADVNIFQAKTRVINYLLLDCGCRMCGGTTEQIRVLEFNWLRCYLSGLEKEKIYTFDEVARMLNMIGFCITINKDEV